MFSIEEYRSRRAALTKKLGNGVIILPSYTLRLMSNDTHYEFRQQSDFLYFTGFPEPDSVAVIEINDEITKYTLFVPKRDKTFEIWNGKRYGTEGAIKIFGADEAYTNEEFEIKIGEILKNYETVFYISGENDQIDEVIHQKMRAAAKSRERKGKGPFQLNNCVFAIHEIRVVKSDVEIEIMKKSAEISADAMIIGIKVTKPGMIESQVESVIEYHYAKNGAVRPAYSSIVGSGSNATILHYIENSAIMKDGDLLLVDAGAEYMGYASDITRTWPVNGKFTEAQQEIYQLVLDVQESCINMAKPGATILELHQNAIRLITEGLVKIGLLEGDVDTLIEEGKFSRFFMHGLSHYLGMDVHDTGNLGRNYKLPENSYLTIEPGIYIPEDDDIPEKYRGIGVRIEDDILVTSTGPINLTEKVPKSIEEIEALVGTMDMP